MEVLVNYSKKFMGEIIKNEYITFVNNYDDIDEIYEALYSDPYVIGVEIHEYNLDHAEEFLNRHPYGYYNHEDDYGVENN